MHVITEVCVFGTQEENKKKIIIIKISGPDKSVDNFHCSENMNGAFWRDRMLGNLTRNIQKPNSKTVRHQIFVLTSTTYRYT